MVRRASCQGRQRRRRHHRNGDEHSALRDSTVRRYPEAQMNPAVPLLIVEAIEQEPDSVVLISPTLTEYLPRGEPTGPSIYPLAVANWCGCPVYVDPDMMPGCFLLVRRNEF